MYNYHFQNDTKLSYSGFRIRKFKLYLNNYQKAFFNEIIKNYSRAFTVLSAWLENSKLSKKQKRQLISEINAGNDISYIVGKGFPDGYFRYYTDKLPRDARRSLVFEATENSRVRRDFGFFRHTSFATFIKSEITSDVTFDLNNYMETMFKDKIKLHIPENLLRLVSYEVIGTKFSAKHLRISKQGNQFYAEIIFSVKRYVPKQKKFEIPERYFAGIDLNLTNITVIDSYKKIPMILSLKHLITPANKEIHNSRKLKQLYKSTFKLYASKIIKHCYYNRISDIAIAKVKQQKHFRNLWDLIPWDYFYRMMISLAELHGISIHIINESFTSQASALDNDPLTDGFRFSGKRISRGLYKSKSGIVIHSDINAAANILRKISLRFNKKISFTKYQLSISKILSYKLIRSVKTLCQAMVIKKLSDFKPNQVVHLDRMLGELSVCKSSPGPWPLQSDDSVFIMARNLPTGEPKVLYKKTREGFEFDSKPEFMEVTRNEIISRIINLGLSFRKLRRNIR